MNALAPAIVGVGTGVAISWLAGMAVGRRLAHTTIRVLLQRRAQVPFTATASSSLAWKRNKNSRAFVTYFMKTLFTEPSSGNRVMLIRYPVGEINPLHRHRAGHGMYVLSGSLYTHRGIYGPGTFVWFPPGELMWHGAGPDEAVEVIFMAGQNMRTEYLGAE